jgi:hypothetical protein
MDKFFTSPQSYFYREIILILKKLNPDFKISFNFNLLHVIFFKKWV